jgi:dUTP pyrophosphatase
MMISKEQYENDIRCKGICGFCNDRLNCYQGQKYTEEYGSTIDMEARIMQETIREVTKPKRLRGFEFVSMEQGLKDFDEASILDCELKLPKRGTSKSAGYDIFAPYDITLQPNEEIKVPTGLKAYMQDGEVLMAFPRSGLGFKYYCRLANTIGVIDSDYYNNPNNEGHMFVKLRNEGTKEMIIKQGDGMCQMIFMPFLLVDGDSFNEGETRQGGFGSTTGGNK